MSVVETGYQSYQIWNMYNEGGSAGEMTQGSISSANGNQVMATLGDAQVSLQGTFQTIGSNLASVTGTVNDLTVTKNGSVFFTDHYSEGADWQGIINSFDYNLSLLAGNDRFIASATQNINDLVQSMGGNDFFTGYGDANGYNGSNGDQFYGGNGIDTAAYRGAFYEYMVQDAFLPDHRGQSYQSVAAKTVTDSVGNRDGLDKLFDVERLHFSDTNIAFDVGVGEHAGAAYRLYKAAFDRAPDEGGLGFWISAIDSGASLTSVAKGFISSPEFQNLYGNNVTDKDFVTKLYNNVLDRNPDQGGYDFWLGTLAKGSTREDVLVKFSESPENVANVADLIAHGIQYQQWGG